MWTRIGVIQAGEVADRFWHAGLSVDSRKCFIAATDDEAYFVWNLELQEIVWVEDETTPETDLNPGLEEWIQDGFITLNDEKAGGRFRIFGLSHNHALTRHPTLELTVEVDQSTSEAILVRDGDLSVCERLKYEAFSGDWAFASFSEDGTLLAILEPYYLTLYRQAKIDQTEVHGPASQ